MYTCVRARACTYCVDILETKVKKIQLKTIH